MNGTGGALILRTVTQKDLTHHVLALPGELVGSLLPNAEELGRLYRSRLRVARIPRAGRQRRFPEQADPRIGGGNLCEVGIGGR
jgi:hypothetical protein